MFAGGTQDADSLGRDLRHESEDDYQIARYLALKLVPGAHALHPAAEVGERRSRIRSAAGRCGADSSRWPQSGLVAAAPPKDFILAIHSLSYSIAPAGADKDFSWAHADPAMIARPVIGRLIGLVAQDPVPCSRAL